MELTREGGARPGARGVPPVPRARAPRRLLQRRAGDRPGRHRDRHDEPGCASATSRASGLTRDCDKPCISPLHTHATDGVLHTETKTPAAEQPRPVLRRVERPPRLELRRRVLRSRDADRDLRRRRGSTRAIRGRSSSATGGRSRSSSAPRPTRFRQSSRSNGRRRHQPRQEPTTRATSSTRGRCARRSTRSRSRAPRAATSGTSTASATSTSPRSSSTSRSGTSTRRWSPRSRSRRTGSARSGR